MLAPIAAMEALEKADIFAIDFETRACDGYPDTRDVKTNPYTAEIE